MTSHLGRILGALLVFGSLYAGGATIERSVDVTTKEKNPATARRVLLDQAQTQAIEDLVRETLGPERFQKNRAAIQSKVLRLSSRLIPFSKAGNLETTADGHKMSVQVRINVDDLDQLLINQGLYFESDVPPVILPLVAWIDKTDSEQFAWWTTNPNQGLANWSAEFEQVSRREFLKEGFFILAPQQFRFQEAYTEGGFKLGVSDIQKLSAQRQSQVVILGEVQIIAGGATGRELELKLHTLHVPRNRVLGQVGRRVPLEKNAKVGIVSNRLRDVFETVAKDLANQTIEAWQRGAIQSNNYRITVAGSLSPAQIEAFRDGFRTKVREVKTLRERLINSTSTTFEMDSPVAPKDLAQRVSEIPVGSGKMVLKDVLADELRYQFAQ
ncbi:MAG: hypothetical protein KF767_16115 [Bdellovibrionaceae bacterium]|nr:hypothetical protein [Pseudobdellovibrionaceae bacterium]